MNNTNIRAFESLLKFVEDDFELKVFFYGGAPDPESKKWGRRYKRQLGNAKKSRKILDAIKQGYSTL